MSATGIWVVGTVPDGEVFELTARFSGVLTDPGPMRPDVFADSLAWSRDGGDVEPFFEDVPGRSWLRSTDAAVRFAELVHNANPDTDAAYELWDACLELVGENDPDDRYVAVARKASPIAALFHGLGAAGSSLLPGRFGDFLLSSDEVMTARPSAEEALGLTGSRRALALGRIDAWMTGMGDEPGFAAAELLDAPLRVLRRAAASGHGVAAFSRWY